jgi:predicted nuclease of predicted toxin-antitoxin system
VKFLADECCDTGVVTSLRADGHDVAYVLERQTGIPDEEVLHNAFVEGRILLTEDKDFGELIYRLKKPACGIILIRIDVQERYEKWPRLEALIAKHEDRLPGHFVVLEMNKYRFRPLIFKQPPFDQLDL